MRSGLVDFFSIDFWTVFTDTERYRELVEGLGLWAPAIAIGAMVVVSFLPLPAETVAIANGAVFGRWLGFLLTWAGALLAALLAFCLARWLGRPLVERFMPKAAAARFDEMVERRGAPFLLLARMAPFVPYTVVNYGSGLSSVRLTTYLWTSALGMIPPIFAFVSIGALMTEQPWIGWVSLGAAILIFALLGFYMRGYFFGAKPRD